jgi:two-component system, OmpR family, sensor histidine kinase VicK
LQERPTTSDIGSSLERNEIVYGQENVVNEELGFFSNSKYRIDTCMDKSRPSLTISIEPINKSFLDAKKRGVELRYLTEITEQNISSCKKLMEIVDELRHLDGLKGNFMVNEKEYLAPSSPFENTKPASRLFYSNIKDIVEQHVYLFQVLWDKAISARKRIKEIEDGVTTKYETRVVENPYEISKHLKYVIENAPERSVCSSIGGLQQIYQDFFDLYKKKLARSCKGTEEAGREKKDVIRLITTITDKDSIDLVKKFLEAGAKVRHVKNLPLMDFAVDNQYFHATIRKDTGRLSRTHLISNEPAYVEHFKSIFEEFWKDGIDATERIKDIYAGANLADIEVIPKASRARELYFQILKDATEEVLLLFPTVNAFTRQEKIVVRSLLLSNTELRTKAAAASTIEKNVKVRILTPFNQLIEQKMQQFKNSSHINIEIRYIEPLMLTTQATILVADRKNTLVMEIKDDSKTTFDEAIGLSTYSNSKAGVLSYVFIFENLWKQIELYEDIKKSHEELMILDKMQQEFINVAAHELRTPIQPILSITQILRSRINDSQQQESLDIVIRNAKRLNRLSDEILDVTKLESQTLELKKEPFNLNDVILNAMDDIVLSKELGSKNNSPLRRLRLSYEPSDILLQADKSRIAEVISNLLSNAIKFTPAGTITISVEKENTNKNNKDWVIVSVKDTGQGIDASIFPRLFTKFASKSFHGTGLGLFISKGIVEAHGGKIWAKNNVDGLGATFSFSLPAL